MFTTFWVIICLIFVRPNTEIFDSQIRPFASISLHLQPYFHWSLFLYAHYLVFIVNHIVIFALRISYPNWEKLSILVIYDNLSNYDLVYFIFFTYSASDSIFFYLIVRNKKIMFEENNSPASIYPMRITSCTHYTLKSNHDR